MTNPSAANALGPDFVGYSVDLTAGINNGGVPVHNPRFVHPSEYLQLQDEILLLIETGQIVKAYNNLGLAIDAGAPLFVQWDAANDRLTLTKACASFAAGLDRNACYIAMDSIADGAAGLVTKRATITGLDTSGFGAEGDPVYLDPTTAGTLTPTKPSAADQFVQRLGYVSIKDAVAGAIAFDVQAPAVFGTDGLQDDAVVESKIVDGAVTTDKIADLNVTTGKLADGAATIEDKVSTAETDTTKVLRPDGAGGLAWGTPAAGALQISLSHDSEGDTGANQIKFSIQVKDGAGNNVAYKGLINLWISDTDGGAPTSTFISVYALNTGTAIRQYTANADYAIETDATGLAEVTITDAGVHDHWVMVEIDGKIYSAQGSWS